MGRMGIGERGVWPLLASASSVRTSSTKRLDLEPGVRVCVCVRGDVLGLAQSMLVMCIVPVIVVQSLADSRAMAGSYVRKEKHTQASINSFHKRFHTHTHTHKPICDATNRRYQWPEHTAIIPSHLQLPPH